MRTFLSSLLPASRLARAQHLAGAGSAFMTFIPYSNGFVAKAQTHAI
jgi:hypothetical protein